MSKYTIAIFVGSKNGVSYYRQAIPHSHIARNYPEFKFIFKTHQEDLTEEELKEVNLVHYSGYYDFNKESTYRKKGIVVVLDKDDWWQLPQHHPRAFEWEMKKIWYRTELSIAAADHIICTTPYLADKVKEINPNITIIPNAFDPQVEQYQVQKWDIDPDFVRFGWTGGNSHLYDCILLTESIKKLDDEKMMRGRWQMALGGFVMGEFETTQIRVDKDGNQKKVKIAPVNTTWGKMERVFTNNYNILRGRTDFINHLAKFKEDDIYLGRESYRRIWMKDVTQYCKTYNELDVCLAPLIDDEFNRCKSQLKLIEAGVFGRPLICSKVYPYEIDGLNEENCIFVNQNSASNTFHTAMRKFLINPDLIKTMGAKLKELVYEKYDINKVNVERVQLYKYLIDKKNVN